MLVHFALQKLHILPSTIANMSKEEKAFVYASIIKRVESEKKEYDKINRIKTTSKGRR